MECLSGKNMELNYMLVVVATIAQFILGAVWYSPLLFGKWWMEIMECTNLSPEELKAMQKSMMPFYGLQFFLTLFSTFSLATFMIYVADMNSYSAYHVAFWIWIGFMAPTQISTVVWGNTKMKFWVKQMFVMLSMQFVGIMVAAWILSM